MPSTAIGCGLALILLGAAGYVWGMIGGNASVTALIPAFFGIVIAIMGAVAKSNENLRKHLMHGAVMVALIGFLVPAVRILMKLGSITFFSAAFLSQLVMALLCLIFLVLGIQSFINARRTGAV